MYDRWKNHRLAIWLALNTQARERLSDRESHLIRMDTCARQVVHRPIDHPLVKLKEEINLLHDQVAAEMRDLEYSTFSNYPGSRWHSSNLPLGGPTAETNIQQSSPTAGPTWTAVFRKGYDVKSDIRAIKGLLLSRRNFAAAPSIYLNAQK